MIRMLKKMGMLLVLVAMIVTTVGPISIVAEPAGRIVLDGTLLETDVPPKLRDGRLFVPMRAIFTAYGVEPEWEASSKTITARHADGESLQLRIGVTEARLGNDIYMLDAAPFVEDGRTFVPVRFISERFGAEVVWEEDTRTAIITTDPSVETGADDVLKEPDPADFDRDHPGHEEEELFVPTRDDIRSKWADYAPSFQGDMYRSRPSISAPYRTGELHPEFIRDGVKAANFVRYLAGLPDDLTADNSLNVLAQHGAVLLSAHGRLTHNPERPADMNRAFYDQGYKSTTTSNIAYYNYATTGSISAFLAEDMEPGHGLTLAGTVFSYMRDHDDTNVARVGHRRWILDPLLEQVGFGYSDKISTEGEWETVERYSTMQVMNARRDKPSIDYDYIAWPAQGYFPTDLFHVTEEYGSDPWSVSLNPDKYMPPDEKRITVTLTDLDSGDKWVLDRNDSTLRRHEPFFHVDLSPIGIGNSIVFRPDDRVRYEDGNRFAVRITGLQDRAGNEVEIEYETHFFQL